MNLIKDLTNKAYHSESLHLSSSSLKLLLTDLPKFHKEKILGIREPQKDSPHFVEGSFLHTHILEFDKIKDEYAIFPEFRKSGQAWENFKASVPEGIDILSAAQELRVQSWINGYKKNKLAVDLVLGSQVEVSLFKPFHNVPLKVRADIIDPERGFIADIKTTSFDIGADSFKMTMDKWSYKLSASLYLSMFEQELDKPLEFYFIVISKKDSQCEVYRLSKESRSEGDLQVLQALQIYKRCLESGDWTGALNHARLVQEEVEEV